MCIHIHWYSSLAHHWRHLPYTLDKKQRPTLESDATKNLIQVASNNYNGLFYFTDYMGSTSNLQCLSNAPFPLWITGRSFVQIGLQI